MREPSPGLMPPACEADGDSGDCTTTDNGVGFFDLPGMVVNAITSFLGTLLEQVMKPVREFLADTLLATPDVTQQADIKRLWTAMLGLTAGVYVLFVTAGGITVMGYETVQTRYALQQIAPRLLFGMVASAGSLTVMGKAINLSNALAHAVMATGMQDAGKGMVEQVLPFALFGVSGLKLYLVVLATVMVCLIVAVLIGFLVRAAVMALLAVAAPLMLACHAHPLTDPVARLWWRALGGCLAIQIAQSMTFVLGLKLYFAPGATLLGVPKAGQLGTLLAGVALFWVLFKIPGWTLQLVLRGTPMHNPHAPRMLKQLAMYRLMDRYMPGMRRLRGGRGPGGGGSGLLGRGGPLGGGGGRRPPGGGPGRGLGGGVRGRGRALLARGRAVLARVGGRPGAASRPAGPSPGRGGAAPAAAGSSRGPRAVIHPARARRAQQLALPIGVRRTPARPGRATQLWLPIPAERVPARTTRSRSRATSAGPAPAVGGAGQKPRGRQLALPIPTRRVRIRPPRPMQLRLPLEPPRR
ncbi:hypothetical protein [Actinacidiphila sp. bgisy167]|uniref:hypothetical protein n=1 Tax=Actinacidiphila sp. bgisy167 TaxID=3413797 RepID=UPI003D735BB7